MQELTELVGTHGAKTRGEVAHHESGHSGRQPVVDAVRDATADPGLTGPVTGADDHVHALIQALQQALDEDWIVLAVGIHEDEDIAARRARAALYRGAIAH